MVVTEPARILERLGALGRLGAVDRRVPAQPAGPIRRPAGAGRLRRRSERAEVTALAGRYADPCQGCCTGRYLLGGADQYVTLSGVGYFVVHWRIEYWKSGGVVVPPAFTGLAGRLLHVASGGGHRLDDQVPGGAPGQTWFGVPGRDPVSLPPTVPMIWQNEFYHLDGTVTLTNRERTGGQRACYSLSVGPVAYTQVREDIDHPVLAGTDWLRAGVAHDS